MNSIKKFQDITCPLYLEETDRKLKETALIFFRLLCLRLFTEFKKTAPHLWNRHQNLLVLVLDIYNLYMLDVPTKFIYYVLIDVIFSA